MLRNKPCCFILLPLLLNLFISSIWADEHLVIEQTMKYMNRVYPKQVTDLWFSQNSFCIKSGRQVIIYRRDLGKIWNILPSRNKYFESDIAKTDKPEEQANTQVSIHKLGQTYNPQFDWLINPVVANDNISGYDCKKFLINGDADYAETNVEIWGTQKLPFAINDLHKEAFEYIQNEKWNNILKSFPQLKDFIIIKSKETNIAAIAPEMIIEREIAKIESTNPPENIYEIPKGCVRVNSFEELYK